MPDTEQELFDSAMSDDAPVQVVRLEEHPEPERVEADTQKQADAKRDEKGRFAPVKTEEARPEVKAEEAPQETQKAEKSDERSERGEIPAWRLREEAEAKREAIARADKAQQEAEQGRRELAALQQRLAHFERQQAETKNPPPDRYADPDGYDAYQQQQWQKQRRADMAANNLELARIKFGDELVDKADAEISQYLRLNPHDPILQVIENSPRPAFEVVKWFKQQEANKRLAGKSIDDLLKEERENALNDPAFLAQAIERAKATAKPVQNQANTNIPSLNRTTAAASDSVADEESDASIFKSALTR